RRELKEEAVPSIFSFVTPTKERPRNSYVFGNGICTKDEPSPPSHKSEATQTVLSLSPLLCLQQLQKKCKEQDKEIAILKEHSVSDCVLSYCCLLSSSLSYALCPAFDLMSMRRASRRVEPLVLMYNYDAE
ncbi:hypothetical protein PoB_000149500, partial [Plakobranchus ocellatus]